MKPKAPAPFPTAWLLVGLALAAASLSAPPILWEWRNIAAGRAVAANGLPNAYSLTSGLLLIHPPSMAYAVGAAIKLFGEKTWVWRLPGLLALLGQGSFVWALGAGLFGPAAGAVAAALYWTNPLAVQGALGVDFADGSLLTLAAAAFLWALLRRSSWSAGRRAAWLGVFLCLSVWSKLATSFLLICAFSAAAWLERGREDARRVWLGACAWGAGLFLATWGAYCLWLSRRAVPHQAPLALALEPVRYLLGDGAATPVRQAGAAAWALYELSFAAYAGPLLLLAAAAAVWRWAAQARRARALPGASVLPLFLLACLALYGSFLGGGRAYPKYFHTLLVPAVVLAAGWLMEGGEEPPVSWLAAATAWYALAVGDFLYTLNYTLRLAQLDGHPRRAMSRLAAQGALYALPALAVVFQRAPRRALAALAVGSQLGLSLVQLHGGYDLRQAYGASQRDFLAAARLVSDWGVSGPVLADRGFVEAAGGRRVEGYGSSSWEDLGEIAGFIETQKPKAVVYGLSLNTIAQLRAIPLDARLSRLMARDYDLREVGQFTVWLRRGLTPTPNTVTFRDPR